jgi:hypothetical protein
MSSHSPTGSASGFFRALFDLSFRSFITPQIIRILYVLALIAIGIWAVVGLFAIVAMLNDPWAPTGLAVLFLLGWPVALLFAVVYARVLLEFVAVVFHIGSATEATARNTWPSGGPSARPAASPPGESSPGGSSPAGFPPSGGSGPGGPGWASPPGPTSPQG